MTSYYGDMQTLRTPVSEGGRPKPTQIKEDANCIYYYTRSGEQSCQPKGLHDKYYDFLFREAIYHNNTNGAKGTLASGIINNVNDNVVRITPETEYEKSMGYGAINLFWLSQSLPKHRGQVTGSASGGLISGHLLTYTTEATAKKIKKDLADAQAEEDRLARELALIRQTAKPKKETVFVAPPEIVENPLSYSPLLVAGVIAVVVILLLKRRRA